MTSRTRRPVAGAVAALALSIVVAACATEADPSVLAPTTETTSRDRSPTTEPADPSTTAAPAVDDPDGFVPEPIDWQDCGNAECARVEAPLDHDDPTGDTIELLVARVSARGEREGALFFNPGGPGAATAELTGMMAMGLPTDVRERFDLVGIDPRGIGESAPLDCGPDPQDLFEGDASVDDEDDVDALLERSRELAQDCAERAGDLLPHVGSRDVARDMDVVRAAMGDEQLSYLGFSYGTVIGQVYADLFPHRVRAMVLDGLVELGRSGLDQAEGQAAGFEQAIERFAESCASDATCPVGPDPLAVLDDVRARAEDGDGIPAPDADRPAGPDEVLIGSIYAMYAAELWPLLEQALAEAADGDASRLVGLADGYLDLVDFAALYAVTCLDFARDDVDDVLAAAEQAEGRFGPALVADAARCSVWPVPADPLEPVTAPDAPPILVVSTTGDPATPHSAGIAVAETLATGVLVTYEGDGHGVVLGLDPCINRIVVDYLVALEAPPDGTTCP